MSEKAGRDSDDAYGYTTPDGAIVAFGRPWGAGRVFRRVGAVPSKLEYMPIWSAGDGEQPVEKALRGDVIAISCEQGITIASVQNILSFGFVRDSGPPTNLAQLADRVREEDPKKHRVVALLSYMHKNPSATFEELRQYAFEGDEMTEDTIKWTIKKAVQIAREAKIPVRLRVSRWVLSRIYMSE
jgi:hypothetical protein